MSERLEVLLDEEELAEIQRAAERERVPLGEWVLAALREHRRRDARNDVQEKLAAVRRAAEHHFPVGDVADMMAEIESGYLDGGR